MMASNRGYKPRSLEFTQGLQVLVKVFRGVTDRNLPLAQEPCKLEPRHASQTTRARFG